MRSIFALLFILSASLTSAFAQTKVIAHRGYWNCEGSAQNSITALKNSAKIGAYGSEFDVLMTKDQVLVVNHDNVINGIDIQKVNYADLKDEELSNGEKISTLEQYLKEGRRHKKLKLIFELKPHYTEAAEDVAINLALDMIKELKMEDQVEFISFSLYACEQFRARCSAPVQYLSGTLSPAELKERGFGMDYHFAVYSGNPTWAAESKSCGVLMNAWTVSDLNVLKSLVESGVDYITTDYPEEVALYLKRIK